MASYFTLLLCISLAVFTVSELSCIDCTTAPALPGPEFINCTYGGVQNPCSCIFECRKGEGEECGGPLDVFGTCAEGLICHGGYRREKPGHCKVQRPIGR
ncbi:single insulin-like growth factor-binding domain protein-2 isoform X2 [Macrobrachium rosenbergii]|uniref:single insulin-like growth factor-binding domain protein-2 isoform X2 n=1 Tax=Macrobrachium rosenbergii TaxID=79674 RepID=UPI0034D57E0C